MSLCPLAAPEIVPPRASVPVLLSIPHSGRDYPHWLTSDAVAGRAALESLEDPFVDRLAWRAIGSGVGAVIARAPRAAIDCNRAPEEVDARVVTGGFVGQSSPRASAGLGIVPGRTARDGNLWWRSIDLPELDRRIAAVHAPFHAAIQRALDRLAIAHGEALLLDCHSMPPRRGQAQIVIGDRHGSSAAPWISAAAARIVRDEGWSVALNQPYAGGHIVDRHGRPGEGVHALQIEIDRRCYLRGDLRTPGPGFDRCARLIAALVDGLALSMKQCAAFAAE